MSVLNGPMSAFARAINALAEKKGTSSSAEPTADKPAAEAVVEVAASSAPESPAAEPAAA